MLRDVVPFLRCPHCARDLTLQGTALHCASGHAFDLARQGYVSLLTRDARTGTADTAAMVSARERFLGAGHYEAVADLVASAVTTASQATTASEAPGGLVVDLGSGTGYHLTRVLEALPHHVGLALDVSKHAARHAARAHPRIGAVVCDAWAPLPVRDGAAAVVLSVFAPRDGAEIARTLRADGVLLVVTPTTRHLAELVDPLGMLTVDERKAGRLHDKLDPYVLLDSRQEWEAPMVLRHEDLVALVGMGPSAWHTDPAAVEQAVRALPDPVTVTAAVTVSRYLRR